VRDVAAVARREIAASRRDVLVGMDPVFEPDCRGFYFVRGNGSDAVILYSRRATKTWKPPQLAPFSGVWWDIEPSLSPDAKYLIFASNRPAIPGQPALDSSYKGAVPQGGGNLWKWIIDFRAAEVPDYLKPLACSGKVFKPPLPETGSRARCRG
jgi:hypothetical protein